MALIGRIIVSLAVWARWGGFLFGDDTTYSMMASQVLSGESSTWPGQTHELFWNTATFSLPLVVVYAVFGEHPLAGQLLAALFGAAAAAVAARLALEVLEPAWAAIAGLLVALLPSQVLWSSLTMKDAAVYAVAAATALAVVAMTRSTGRALTRSALMVALTLFLLGHLRAHTTMAAIVALVVAAWVVPGAARIARGFWALGLAVVVPLLLGLGPAGIGFIAEAGSFQSRRYFNALDADTAVVDVPDGGSAASEPPDVVSRGSAGGPAGRSPAPATGTTSGAPRSPGTSAGSLPEPVPDGTIAGPPRVTSRDLGHLPRGLSVMLLEPYPWQRTDNRRVALARLEAIAWYPMLLLGVVGLAGVRRHPDILLFPLLLGGAVLVGYALAEGNFGTAFRHRGELVWIVALFAAIGSRDLCRSASAMRRCTSGDV